MMVVAGGSDFESDRFKDAGLLQLPSWDSVNCSQCYGVPSRSYRNIGACVFTDEDIDVLPLST